MCSPATAVDHPQTVTVSPDGASVYAAAIRSDAAVAVFDRAADGALSQKRGTAGCISADGSAGACATGRALVDPVSVTGQP